MGVVPWILWRLAFRLSFPPGYIHGYAYSLDVTFPSHNLGISRYLCTWVVILYNIDFGSDISTE